MKYPQTFRIVGTLKAPAGATPEDVERIFKYSLPALQVESVVLDSKGEEETK